MLTQGGAVMVVRGTARAALTAEEQRHEHVDVASAIVYGPSALQGNCGGPPSRRSHSSSEKISPPCKFMRNDKIEYYIRSICLN